MDNKWIPTSERLPEVDKYGEAYVLVCMNNNLILPRWTAELKYKIGGIIFG